MNEKEEFEIQLSGKSLTNQSLRSNIQELEQFLSAEGTETRRIHLDLTDNPEVTDADSDSGEGGFTTLVLFLRSFGSDVTKLKIGGTGITGDGLLSLIDFVKLGVAEELNFSRLPKVDESTALAVLTAVQECHRYPINKKLPLLLKMDRIGLDDPKYILAKAFDNVDECYEVLSETPEVLAAEAARKNQGEAPNTTVMVSLPFFYAQEPIKMEKPVTPNPPQPEAPETEEPPAEPAQPKALTPDVQPKPPSLEPPPHLLWKAAPKSEMALKSLEAQIEQSTSSKAPPPPRPKPSSSLALATPPPKLPPRKALPPPPPRPMAVEAFSAPTSSEVRKVPSKEKLELEPDKAEDDEKNSWIWWKGRWWDWDSQEKKYIEVEQSDKAHGWAHDIPVPFSSIKLDYPGIVYIICFIRP